MRRETTRNERRGWVKEWPWMGPSLHGCGRNGSSPEDGIHQFPSNRVESCQDSIGGDQITPTINVRVVNHDVIIRGYQNYNNPVSQLKKQLPYGLELVPSKYFVCTELAASYWMERR